MSSTSQFFKTAAGQPTFNQESRVSDYAAEPALGALEPTALTISAKFWQLRENYVTPAANSPLAYGSVTAYFIADTGFSDLGAGITEWTRTWATVPAQWSDYEEYAYTYPAFVVPAVFGTVYTVTDIIPAGSVFTLLTSATGISAGDNVYLGLSFSRGGRPYNVTFVTAAVTVNAGVSVNIGNVLPGSGSFTSVANSTLRKGTIGRSSAESIIANSRLQHDYALSSDASIRTDLPLLDPFTPVNTSGYPVTSLGTALATVPNSSVYSGLIDAGAELVVNSRIARYAGNIFVRTTRLVPAL